MVAEPLPLAGLTVAIAVLALLAVHAHPACVVNAMVLLDAAAETLADVGLIENVHEELGGAPQPMSAKMPSMIGPGVWMASALPIDGVINELTLPAVKVDSFRCE
jgi:hypothetical protein